MVWYVSAKRGSDANDGRSLTKPFKTIPRALQAARAGDTLLIAPGVYDQELDAQIEAARAAGLIVAVAEGPA
jgi:hypothetical protein